MSLLSETLGRASGRRKGADPIFEAIENHRRAYFRLDRACRATDKVEAEHEGRKITDADEVEWDFADAAEEEALNCLKATLPATAAGARALVQYIRYRGCAWTEATSAILLTNVMHSAPLSDAPWRAP